MSTKGGSKAFPDWYLKKINSLGSPSIFDAHQFDPIWVCLFLRVLGTGYPPLVGLKGQQRDTTHQHVFTWDDYLGTQTCLLLMGTVSHDHLEAERDIDQHSTSVAGRTDKVTEFIWAPAQYSWGKGNFRKSLMVQRF